MSPDPGGAVSFDIDQIPGGKGQTVEVGDGVALGSDAQGAGIRVAEGNAAHATRVAVVAH